MIFFQCLQLKNGIPSPARLFVRADLVTSRYGTLVWLNSEADLITPTSTFASTDSYISLLRYEPNACTFCRLESANVSQASTYDINLGIDADASPHATLNTDEDTTTVPD